MKKNKNYFAKKKKRSIINTLLLAFTWTVESVARSCLICWTNPFAVFSTVLRGGIIALSGSNLTPTPTGGTAWSISTPDTVSTIN